MKRYYRFYLRRQKFWCVLNSMSCVIRNYSICFYLLQNLCIIIIIIIIINIVAHLLAFITLLIPMVTICTTRFKTHKSYVLPKLYLCVLCGSENKQQLFPYTA